MTTMTGGEAVVATLEALGVEHVFGIVSVHNLPIIDAVGRSDRVTLVPCRHEQGAAHAADGYARVTGKLGVVITSTGPGAANAMGGLFEAYTVSSPVLMITGQVESDQLGRGKGALHEAESQLDMLRAVTKRCDHVGRHVDIVPTLVAVAAEAMSGRPRPVAVQIPVDLQYAKADIGPIEVTEPRRVAPTADTIAAAVAALADAERPLIVAGGGAVGAAAELTALAERLDAPVFTTVEGRGAIAEDHRLALGPNTDLSAMDPVFAEADVVVAVGTRFQQNNNVHKWLTLPGTLIHLDADPATIGRVHPADVALLGDAGLGLAALAAALDEATEGDIEHGDWVATAIGCRDEALVATRDSAGADLMAICEAIRETLPRDGVVAKDATISAYAWANRLLPVYEPRTALRPASMAIGPGVPLALGAAVGSGRPTVVVQGDGGLMLSVGELASIVQQQLPVVVCVFNDGGYGILRFIQDMAVQGRHTGVDLATPDFAAMATSFGMSAASVDSVDGFTEAFAEAVAAGTPWLLDIDLSALTPMSIQPQPRPERT